MWNTLEDLDKRISELDGNSDTYDDTEVKALISALDERVTALETPSESSETPSEPSEP